MGKKQLPTVPKETTPSQKNCTSSFYMDDFQKKLDSKSNKQKELPVIHPFCLLVSTR